MDTDNRLAKLLREADAGVMPPAAGEGDFAAGVFRASRRRRIRRAGVGTASAAALLIAAAFAVQALWPRPVESPHRAGADDFKLDANVIRAETAAIEAQIELHEELVARLAALERHQREIGRLRRELEAPSAIERLQQELDRAAFAAMLRAEKTYRLDNRPQEATVYYRQVLRLDPASRWAELARRRLNEIENQTPPESSGAGKDKDHDAHDTSRASVC
ncbi:MAG TPA: hypothetical protein VNA25_23630 [Phycisphaerae bacterium]|nr:hypothetical protein [Phycisphaerae bacterium]